MNKTDAIIGCLLGTAVGDALGLPYEGISKHRLKRLFPELDRYHFCFGKGMVSDDTEHTCMVAQALLISHGDVQIFRKELAWKLRWWLLGLPAGVGYATLRAIAKLWLGFPSDRSGVFSAGNGSAMRSAILGVCYGDYPQKLRELVRASTRLTHTDPKAEYGAIAVAIAAHMSYGCSIDPSITVTLTQRYAEQLQNILGANANEFLELMAKTFQSIADQQQTLRFAQELGDALHIKQAGVSGYIYHTVPVVIHAWLSHPQDYRTAIMQVIECGGDTDTTAAILGGIMGAGVGKNGIPAEWLNGIWEWYRSVSWMEQLGTKLAQAVEGEAMASVPKVPSLPVYGICIRNFFFLLVVLTHGFRRLLPPY